MARDKSDTFDLDFDRQVSVVTERPAAMPRRKPISQKAPRNSSAGKTVVLDQKQHAELMALRAQQDQSLQKRFEKSVAVMFTDLVGSTAYYERHGDVRGREKVLTHNALLFPLVQRARGLIIKTIGDAIMACFDSVDDAVAVAAAMQHALANHNADVGDPDEEIHIRVAINYGIAIAQDGDLYGDVVNVAARIESKTPTDEVYVSREVREHSTGWPWQPVGAVAFKGKEQRLKLYRLGWERISRPSLTRGFADLPKFIQLGARVAHGDIGDSFRGRDSRNGAELVVKGLHDFLARDARANSVFRRASAKGAHLKHVGIVRVHAVAPDESKVPWVASEWVAGRNLGYLVRHHGPPSPTHAALIVYRVAQIVAYAHSQHVFHGDLKPENVLVTDRGEVRLINFGMAVVAATPLEEGGGPVGSPAFMAPETLMGAATDTRSDVYSLGALLYFLLCGRSPYAATGTVQATREITSGGFTPVKELTPNAPDELVLAVHAALAVVSDQRPQDMAQLAAALWPLLQRAGLDPRKDLEHYLAREWREASDFGEGTDEFTALNVVESLEPAEAKAAVVVGIPWPVALAAIAAAALVAFALGWQLGAGQTRQEMSLVHEARELLPVDEGNTNDATGVDVGADENAAGVAEGAVSNEATTDDELGTPRERSEQEGKGGAGRGKEGEGAEREPVPPPTADPPADAAEIRVDGT